MTGRALLLALVSLIPACVSTTFNRAIEPPIQFINSARGATEIASWVDEVNHAVLLVAGPFSVPKAEAHDGGQAHHEGTPGMETPLLPLIWPVDMGMQGFRIAAFTADGTELPRDIMHHMIAVNFGRSQLVYPVPERLFGFGTETPDVSLPDWYEVPLERGDSIGLYAMWNNHTGRDLEVYLEVVVPYAEPGKDREAVMPIYIDTNNQIGGNNAFSLPPGVHLQSYEFELPVSGGLLAAGGHLHDYGIELRLVDVETDKKLFDLEGERTPDGRVTGVEQKIFRRFFKLLDARIHLEAGRRYRIDGVFDNPTGETIHDGGMAHIVGLFAPDDPSEWPQLNPNLPEYRIDVENLPKVFDGPVRGERLAP
jgi:hypothetical protein